MKKPGDNVKRYRLSMAARKNLQAYSFIFPFVIGTAVFFIFPLYTSIKLAFGNLVQMRGFVIEWSGFGNFRIALLEDMSFVPMFLGIIRDTLINLPMILIFSLILAIMVNKKIKFKGFFRTVFFLPFLLGTGHLMTLLLNQQVDQQVLSVAIIGLIPEGILLYMGDAVVEWIGTFFGVIVTVLWSSGVQILLFLSALQGIPASLYESSDVDGASEWDKFWKITLPMVAPMMQLVIVYTIMDEFVKEGNPMLERIRLEMFRMTGSLHGPEFAAAIGWLYLAFVFILIAIAMFLVNIYLKKAEKSEVKRRDIY